jgi:hypothetical protein
MTLLYEAIASCWLLTVDLFFDRSNIMEDEFSGALRETKRSRKSFGADDDAPVVGNDEALSADDDNDDDDDEEAILRAAAAWSEKQTGSARVEPSELRKSAAKSWDEEDEYTMKITGSQESVMKLRLILEEKMVTVVAAEHNEADGNTMLLCEFPTRTSYDTLLGSVLDDFAGQLMVEPVKKRKRGEIQRGDSKRSSNRRAAIVMKPIVE